jgi:hypothetical protein
MEKEHGKKMGRTKIFKFKYCLLILAPLRVLFFGVGPSTNFVCLVLVTHYVTHNSLCQINLICHFIHCLPHTRFCNRWWWQGPKPKRRWLTVFDLEQKKILGRKQKTRNPTRSIYRFKPLIKTRCSPPLPFRRILVCHLWKKSWRFPSHHFKILLFSPEFVWQCKCAYMARWQGKNVHVACWVGSFLILHDIL